MMIQFTPGFSYFSVILPVLQEPICVNNGVYTLHIV